MIREQLIPDPEAYDSWESGSHGTYWRLFLGVVALAIVTGYVTMRFVVGGFESEADVVIAALGAGLSGTLMGESVPIRFDTQWPQRFLLPMFELLLTYSLLAVLLAAAYAGLLVVAVVSGLLLVCSFVAIVETPPPDPDVVRGSLLD